MPRYHFHVRDGTEVADTEGSEFPDDYTACREGYRLAGTLMTLEANKSVMGEAWWMEITDGRGIILFRFNFSMVQSATAVNPP